MLWRRCESADNDGYLLLDFVVVCAIVGLSKADVFGGKVG